MSVSFVARKCTQCAGKLEYVKDKKIWKCLYCGAEIERQEQYDGLFTIKNVVRQVLLDASYRRLDNAAKNMVECEKIDSRYVGTLIAKIVCQMITAITPGACEANEVRNLFAQLKRNYEALCNISENVTDDEEALYEFFDSADVYATLLLVYDSMNAVKRKDYILTLLKAGEVYSKEANKNLLSFSIRNSNFAMIDSIIANSGNIDEKFAVCEVLSKCPDGENKATNLAKLFSAGALKPEDHRIIEEYLKTSRDSVQSKSKVVENVFTAGIKVGLEVVVDEVLKKADADTVSSTLKKICSSRLNDEDVYKIVDFAIHSSNKDVAVSSLSCLKETNQYVLLTQKYIIAFLSRADIDCDFKIALLNITSEFNMDEKSKEAVLNNYLCFNDGDAATRLKIITFLLASVKNIATNSLESYALKCGIDKENKPEIISRLFELGLNLSFFNDLLSKYLNSSSDEKAVKDKVVSVFVNKGLKLDPKYFVNYICTSADNVQTTVKIVKKLQQNGSQLLSDAANSYLEQINPDQFSSELFALIYSPSGKIGEEALRNYILFCKDREAVKAENVQTLISRYSGNIADIRCEVTHLGKKISCNLLQAYILISTDAVATAEVVVKQFIHAKIKINAEIAVAGEGVMKLKKYIVANRSNLSALTDQLCEENKVYTMLF